MFAFFHSFICVGSFHRCKFAMVCFCEKQDKSWRVRYMVANQLYELCEAVGPDSTKYVSVTESFLYFIR